MKRLDQDQLIGGKDGGSGGGGRDKTFSEEIRVRQFIHYFIVFIH